ncbi:glucosaminidase domain-containing protein [Terrimonas sp. NA20]|uniref:Glucosaminidase domain-containing protein n=1 Tax=Terrimonas ginsenosidimutans TaxID=2908004 RepID=A0ABS9KRF9_9BACT|nr:glucosaminidase domain-containing protein [Terrimonas ginsenosidimutans]MCG2614918.1 glucosaminidase domain-containing protein [Terrimonas ginsenosidimutans]
MTPKEFVKTYLPYALASQKKTGIHAEVTLTQAALESAWGKAAPGFMFFGVKDTDGINGNEQLITTTEYSRRADLKFPVIISITPVVKGGVKMFKYIVKDYFRKYNTPEECFTDHGNFYLKNKRYAKALLVKDNPEAFIDAIAAAGYATAPDYAKQLKAVLKTVQRSMK